MRNLFLTAVCLTAVLLLISGIVPMTDIYAGAPDTPPTATVTVTVTAQVPTLTPTVSVSAAPTPTVRQVISTSFICEDPPEDVLIPRYYNTEIVGGVHIFAFTDGEGKVAYRAYGSLEKVWSDGECEISHGFFITDRFGEVISDSAIDVSLESYGEAVVLKESIKVDGYKLSSSGVYYFKSAGGIKHYRVYASVGGVKGIYPCDEDGNVQMGALVADIEYDTLLMNNKVQNLFVGDAPHVMLSCPSKTTLINMNNRMAEDYIPQNMVAVSKHASRAPFTLRNNGTYANAEALEGFIELVNTAYAERGIDNLYLCSVYRSYNVQKELWEYRVSNNPAYGTNPLSPIGSAYPGTSEHQSGLAFDIGTLEHKVLGSYLENTKEHKWLAENSWRFGFILRYPKDKQYITGIKFEPYHFRYVGKELAEYLYKENMCLEEYYDAPVRWVNVE